VTIAGSLGAWSGLELVAPLTGGARNEVMLARRGGQRVVVRRSTRSSPALDWELDLLEHLAGHGIAVPVPVPTDDGRRHVDGVLVAPFFEGGPPRDAADWRRVRDVLTAVHELTVEWPQRPTFASSRRLLDAGRGGDVRLDAMPPEAVDAVRDAWRAVQCGPRSAVHGDVGARNALVDGTRVALLDWDEARTDVAWFDFAFIPDDVELPGPVDRHAVTTAGVAWEAATCWALEPDYAAGRLAELYARRGHAGTGVS
jgi:Ser/Thr protein kinase RdoA (MazF antagonist)